ncbi:MAG: type II toxin-antitoxin system YafQ family toxin [Bacteroidia bacterium]|nr:type II toxin-antitoxin system YafQ family toxin [Bacteroidia bacterium]
MKYQLSFGSKFKRDFKTIGKRGYSLDKIATALEILENEGKLPEKYHSHKLSGNYLNCWECHLSPDWLLIWECDETQNEIKMIRTGTHSDLF